MAQYTPEEITALQDQVARQMQQNLPISADLARALQDARIGVRGFSEALEKSIGHIKASALGIAKAGTTAGGGAAQFNQAVGAAEAAIATMSIAFIGVAPKLASFGAGMTKAGGALFKAANSMSDSFAKTYTELAQVGIAGAIGDTFDQIQKFGYTAMDQAEGIQDYTSLLKENSESLAMMGGTAAKGAARLGDIAASIQEGGLSDKFRLLGHDLTAQNKLVANYIRIQTLSGAAQTQSTEQLKTGAEAYILQLDKLARLTGKSSESLAKDEERRMSQARYAFKKAELEDQIKVEGPGGPAAQELARMETLAARAKQMGPQMEQGFMDMISGGRASSEAARAFALSLPEATALLESSTANNSEAVLAAMGRDSEKFVDTFGKNVRIAGEQGFKSFITPIEMLAARSALARGQDPAAAERAAQADQDARMAAKRADGTEDKLATARLELDKNLLSSSRELAKIVNTAVPLATAAVGKLASGVDTAVYSLGNLVEAIDKYIGGVYGSPNSGSRRSAGSAQPRDKAKPAAAGGGAPAAAGGDAPAAAGGGAPAAGGGAPAAVAGGPRAGAGQIGVMTADESTQILSKLNMGGKSAERTGGGEVDPRLIILAQKIAEMYPGVTFTALNDVWHQVNSPKSKHTTGTAMDFVLANAPADATAAAVEVAKIKALGFSKVKDEYFADKSEKASGPHFHAELAQGGIVSGPKSGYNAMLHGTEAVVPLPDGRTIPVEMAGFSGMISQQSDLLGMQLGRMDDLIAQMRALNATSSKMLQYAQG